MSVKQSAENAIFGYPKSGVNQPSMQGVANLFSNVRHSFDDFTALANDVALSYTSGAASYVSSGDLVQVQSQFLVVAASGASDHEYATAGGVKFYTSASQLKPIIVLGLGASNMGININATGGNRDIPKGIYAWDADTSGASYSTGSQFNEAAFGTDPLNVSGGAANSYLLQTSIELGKATGRPVYFILCAMGGHATEAYIDDATLASNGWTRDAGDEDMTQHYSNVATAIAAVPGDKTVADFAVWYGTADISSQDWHEWRDRFKVVWDEIEAAGLISKEKTRIAVSETCRARGTYDDHQLAIRDASTLVPNMAIVETRGLNAPDNIHFDGNGVTELGRRTAAVLLGAGEGSRRMMVFSDEENGDDQSLTVIDHESGNATTLKKYDSGGWIGTEWNVNGNRVSIEVNDGTDTLELSRTDKNGGDTQLSLSAFRDSSNYHSSAIRLDAPRSGTSDGATTQGRAGIAMLGRSDATDAGPFWVGTSSAFGDDVAGKTDADFKASNGFGLRWAHDGLEAWEDNNKNWSIDDAGQMYVRGDARIGQDTSDSPGDGNATAGGALNSGGRGNLSRTGGYVLGLNRNEDGSVLRFFQSGSETVSIAQVSGELQFQNSSSDPTLTVGSSSSNGHIEVTGHRQGSTYGNASLVLNGPRNGTSDGDTSLGRGAVMLVGNSASTSPILWVGGLSSGITESSTDANWKSHNSFGLRQDGDTAEFWEDDNKNWSLDTSGQMYVRGDARIGQDSSDSPGDGNTTTGIALNAGGKAHFSRDGGAALVINRAQAGNQVLFNINGTEESHIRIDGNQFTIGTDGTDRFQFASSQFKPVADNSYDLGSGSQRFDDIYATNGTINTSDENEKTDIEELDEKEMRVAKACAKLVRKYRWKNSVEEKGDAARIHIGVIAQDVVAAFEEEGLNPWKYGILTKTFVESEDGEPTEEVHRLGVRYTELTVFVMAALC
jgi:hypothetical protein